MASNTAEYNREYAKKRRERLKKKRICPVCSTRKAARGKVTCTVCRAYISDWNKKNRQGLVPVPASVKAK